MEKKWFKSALAMLLVIAMVVGIVPDIPNSVSEAEAAYTDNGSADVTVFAEDAEGTGRFPDVTRLADDSLVAVCYWNGVSHHAPFAYGDPMGSVKISYGSADGKTWSEPKVLITPEKLAEWGLGVWYVKDVDGNVTFYYTAEEAEANNAQLAVEARDPNLVVLNDGTLVLTFFTRLPDECNFNGYTFEKNDAEGQDFASGRTYIMYSKDKGENWSNPAEVDSHLLNQGSFKRGNIAVYSDNQILIPLYGYDDVQSNAFHGTCVLAELNEDGTWSFLRETRMWGANGNDTSTYTWETEHSMVVTTLNGQEVTYDLIRSSGNLLISYDRGEKWEIVGKNVEGDDSYFEGASEKLQQPSVYKLDGTNQLFFTWTQAIGTKGQRNVYGKVYTPGEEWTKTSAVLLYKNNTGGGNDVGDPTGIQLENGELFTIYYDVNKRTVGGVINSVDELICLRSERELVSGVEEWKFIDMDFEDGIVGDEYLVQDSNGLWMGVYGTTKTTIYEEEGNKYLKTSIGTSSSSNVCWWFNNISSDATISFDFKMPEILTSGWQQMAVAFGVDTGAANVFFNNLTSGTEVSFSDSAGNLSPVYYGTNTTATTQKYTNIFQAGTEASWYSVKVVWDDYWIYMKIWEKNEAEPEEYTFRSLNSEWNKESKVFLKCTGATTTDTSIWLDNVTISKKTKLSIVETEQNTLDYEFDRDITYELPKPIVVWNSSNPDVVQINQEGKITYVGEGTATITATCDNLTATKQINVGNSWKIQDIDFENVTNVEDWKKSDKYNMVIKSYANASQKIIDDSGNKYLEMSGVTSGDITEMLFDVGDEITLSFDVKFPTALPSSWGGVNVSIGNKTFNPQWQFVEVNGSKVLRLYDSNIVQSKADVYQSGANAPWYTVKFVCVGNTTYVKVWEKGTNEPREYTCEATHSGFAGDGMGIKFVAGTTCKAYIDNIVISKITNFSIVDDGSNTLSYAFDRDVTQELPVPNVIWSSNNEDVVTIDKNGTMTYIGEGTAIITATCDNLVATKEVKVNSWKIHDMDFENVTDVEEWKKTDKYNMVIKSHASASQRIIEENGNKFLEMSGATSGDITEMLFDVGDESTLCFDVKFPTALPSGWGGINVSVGNKSFNPQWQFVEINGSKVLRLYDSNIVQSKADVYQSGTNAPWYTVKFVCVGNTTYVKVWEKGTNEPREYTCEATHSGFAGDGMGIKFVAGTTCKAYIDNVVISKITNFSIVDDGSNTLSYAFDRDVTQELPVPNVTWSSSNEDVIKIDKTTGVMTYKSL